MRCKCILAQLAEFLTGYTVVKSCLSVCVLTSVAQIITATRRLVMLQGDQGCPPSGHFPWPVPRPRTLPDIPQSFSRKPRQRPQLWARGALAPGNVEKCFFAANVV